MPRFIEGRRHGVGGVGTKGIRGGYHRRDNKEPSWEPAAAAQTVPNGTGTRRNGRERRSEESTHNPKDLMEWDEAMEENSQPEEPAQVSGPPKPAVSINAATKPPAQDSNDRQAKIVEAAKQAFLKRKPRKRKKRPILPPIGGIDDEGFSFDSKPKHKPSVESQVSTTNINSKKIRGLDDESFAFASKRTKPNSQVSLTEVEPLQEKHQRDLEAAPEEPAKASGPRNHDVPNGSASQREWRSEESKQDPRDSLERDEALGENHSAVSDANQEEASKKRTQGSLQDPTHHDPASTFGQDAKGRHAMVKAGKQLLKRRSRKRKTFPSTEEVDDERNSRVNNKPKQKREANAVSSYMPQGSTGTDRSAQNSRSCEESPRSHSDRHQRELEAVQTELADNDVCILVCDFCEKGAQIIRDTYNKQLVGIKAANGHTFDSIETTKGENGIRYVDKSHPQRLFRLCGGYKNMVSKHLKECLLNKISHNNNVKAEYVEDPTIADRFLSPIFQRRKETTQEARARYKMAAKLKQEPLSPS